MQAYSHGKRILVTTQVRASKLTKLQGNADLIKTVRGLDQNGVGENGENLSHLWKSLTASADSKYHAVDESSLRWLLKSMNGTSPAAETLRRCPLTWNILGIVFQRIPLFSLAKSLADRRFITVVQQTLKEISTPITSAAGKESGKRKRSISPTFGLDSFKTIEGCISSGHTTLGALGILLRRLDESSTSNHHKVGAEHLRSLFSMPASEASSLVAPALAICALAIQNSALEDAEGREDWIGTISSLWALHLQGSDDVNDFAAQLFGPAATILDKIENISKLQTEPISGHLRKRWLDDTHHFVHHNFILPARSAFLSRQDMGPVTRALESTIQDIGTSGPALYLFSCTAVENLNEQGVRKGNGEWMEQLFQTCEALIRERNNSSEVILNIVEQARKRSMPIKADDLRSACRRYALHDDSTLWSFVANAAQCDPDIFLVSEDGEKLLEEICQRTIDERLPDSDIFAVSEAIDAIIRGHRTGRVFPALLQLWYQQLVALEDRKSETPSPWYDIGRQGLLATFDHSSIEGSLTPKQLLDVVTWVETQKSHPRALCLWLNAVSQGIISESFKEVVGKRLLDLVLRVKKTSSQITSLKWRVISRVLSWVPMTQRTEAWNEVQGDVKKILKKSPVESAETYEAFKACCQVWVIMNPDDPQADEVAKLVETFTTRLATVVTSYFEGQKQKQVVLNTDVNAELRSDTAIQQYIIWYLRGSSRLNKFYFNKQGQSLPTLHHFVSTPNHNTLDIELVCRALLENEHNINGVKLAESLIDQLIERLRESKKEKHWPNEDGSTWLRLISSVPLDIINRPQREAIMAILMDGQVGKKGSRQTSLESLKVILSLATKIMTRPTFYEAMKFQHLVDIADLSSSTFVAAEPDSEALQEIVERYSDLAYITIKQMADDPERSATYFSESANLLSQVEDAYKEPSMAEHSAPLRLTLLKALFVGLSGSVACSRSKELASVLDAAKQSLGRAATAVFEEWASDKKLFKNNNPEVDLRLFAAMDALKASGDVPIVIDSKSSSLKKLESRSQEAMELGDLRGWKLQTFLRRFWSSKSQASNPTTFPSLEALPARTREPLLREHVTAIVEGMDLDAKMQYLQVLVDAYVQGSDADGQLVAIHCIVDQLIGMLLLLTASCRQMLIVMVQ